jgi:hypothetical protein
MGSGFFCQIAAAYFSGLTNGTSATTYSPANGVPREQMAAFVTRTLDQGLRRGSRRAALGRWATPSSVPFTGRTTVGDTPVGVASDGADIWVANFGGGTVSQVQASSGKLIGTWTGAVGADQLVIARGRVFVTGRLAPQGRLYVIDPQQAPGVVATLTNTLPAGSSGITFDGYYIWVASQGGTISRVDPNSGAHGFFAGFSNASGIIFDGTYLWVTEFAAPEISKVDLNGNVLLSLPTGLGPSRPVYDGVNIWVPNFNSSTVTVIRVTDSQGNPLASPFVLATLANNGLDRPGAMAFDGQRILATNQIGNSVSLWRATDLSPLGTFSVRLQRWERVVTASISGSR